MMLIQIRRFWNALVTFGCAITIPEEEMGICAELVAPAVTAASLTNDLFSYEKEYEAAQVSELPDVVNALWVLMGEHKISLEEAKSLCRARIKEEVAQYARIVRETQSRTDLSSDAKRYIELMQYSVSGNVVWSLQCPRYHRNIHYNERQLLREKHGIEKHPTTYQLARQKKRARTESQPPSIPGNKTRGCKCPGLDEIRAMQNGHPTWAADSPSRICKACRDWDILNLAHRRVLPELGHEVSVLEPQALILC
jgi:hypothetical protein